MNRKTRDSGRPRAAILAGLLAACVALPTLAAAEDTPRRSGPPPLTIDAFPNACARCHKADGRGGPAYGGFASNLRITELSHEGLVQVITDGRRNLGMPTFKGVLSKRQIDAIATFIVDNFKGKPLEDEPAEE